MRRWSEITAAPFLVDAPTAFWVKARREVNSKRLDMKWNGAALYLASAGLGGPGNQRRPANNERNDPNHES